MGLEVPPATSQPAHRLTPSLRSAAWPPEFNIQLHQPQQRSSQPPPTNTCHLQPQLPCALPPHLSAHRSAPQQTTKGQAKIPLAACRVPRTTTDKTAPRLSPAFCIFSGPSGRAGRRLLLTHSTSGWAVLQALRQLQRYFLDQAPTDYLRLEVSTTRLVTRRRRRPNELALPLRSACAAARGRASCYPGSAVELLPAPFPRLRPRGATTEQAPRGEPPFPAYPLTLKWVCMWSLAAHIVHDLLDHLRLFVALWLAAERAWRRGGGHAMPHPSPATWHLPDHL